MTPTRAFIAVHLSAELCAMLVSLSRQLEICPGGRAARWLPGENMHLTLKFLGDVEDARLLQVCEAVSAVCSLRPPIDVGVSGLGCFPNTARPRIVWAGITYGAAELAALAAATDVALSQLAFAREPRSFSAHVTLGRAEKHATSAELSGLGRMIAGQRVAMIGHMTVESVSVVKSDLRPAGPLYTDLHVAALGSPPTGKCRR
jgi:2'-5' RNA ligase